MKGESIYICPDGWSAALFHDVNYTMPPALWLFSRRKFGLQKEEIRQLIRLNPKILFK